ncbi:hypothetical protein [Streptomyces sp. SID12501]|uniref:Uncharacterized protein n=1 Tax=Streptomyces sp. SID12501 TaxID=2706042 RepID=A0A6B3C6T4_9ACTN|nr:hypothetical protein [Streptomyces sp. SID12501]NEC92513.1 hypothetical protein [Streptomyces sp. SID12501]
MAASIATIVSLAVTFIDVPGDESDDKSGTARTPVGQPHGNEDEARKTSKKKEKEKNEEEKEEKKLESTLVVGSDAPTIGWCEIVNGQLTAPAPKDKVIGVFVTVYEASYPQLHVSFPQHQQLTWTGAATLGDGVAADNGVTFQIQLVMLPTSEDPTNWGEGTPVSFGKDWKVLAQREVKRGTEASHCP